MWLILVGVSTISRKTTSIQLAQKLLADEHKKLSDAYKSELENYNKTNSCSSDKNNIKKPVRKLLIAPVDITMEKLFEIFVDNQNIIIFANELMNLIMKFEKSYNKDAKAVITDIFDVPPFLEKDTKSGGFLKIELPKLSILTATTKEWLTKSIHEEDTMSGFLARFLFCNLNEIDIDSLNAIPNKMDEVILNKYIKLILLLREFSADLNLSQEAEELYKQFYKSTFKKFEKNNEFSRLSSFIGRLTTDYCFKFCILFSSIDIVSEVQKEKIISVLNMQRSIDLVCYYISQVEQVILQNYIFGKCKNEEKIIKILNKQKDHTIDHSTLMRSVHLDKDKFIKVIENLIAKEYITKLSKKIERKKEKNFYKLIK